MKIPASSRSEIVMAPCGLVDEQKLLRMSGGHGRNQTNGSTSWVPLNHTPPTPHLDASTKPR